MSPLSSTSDRFTIAYAVPVFAFFLLAVFGDQIDRIFNLYLLLVPLLIIPGGALIVGLLVILVINIIRQRWRRVASVLLAPVLAAAPLVLCGYLGVTPTWLRFQLDRAAYEREIAKIDQASEKPRLKAFNWGETGGAAVTNFFYVLVYDESDEINLSPTLRSPEWIERANQEPILKMALSGSGDVSIYSLGDHFYEVTQAY